MTDTPTVTRPRPMGGRVAIAPIPASRESQPGDKEKLVIGKMLFGLEIESGFIAGIVLEIGELPDRLRGEEEFLVPYSAGATVYYQESHAINLKGWHYVISSSIVAWEPADA